MNPTPNDINDLDLLCAEWEEAKGKERHAAAVRRSIEDQIKKLVPNRKEGSNPLELNTYKLTITEKMTRKITDPVLLAQTVTPEAFEKLVRTNYSLDTRSLRAHEKLDPETYKRICRCIETSPASPQFKIEVIA